MTMIAPKRPANPLLRWKTELVADLERVALRDRWGLALMILGWSHLATFVACQVLHSIGDRRNVHYLGLWALEFATNIWVIRRVAGRRWFCTTPLAGVLTRVWATFLILSFNAATLNSLTGFSIEWFKAVWATLSTFGFATTAYLVNPWYFVPAVQMYFTGLLMVLTPNWQYLIYGVSWWATFQGIGLILERRRHRAKPIEFEPAVLELRAVEEALADRR
ncbi:hypothetical protein [Singulisphaera acidiphila]|uniref:Uncharacterized protein n=1 Tax=Singulisphaera acidiphila (strain ATCC BAA-1392 / DSM 18658 / VKM B-2454 / MOB10) TaxID=886293 RepID=L0DA52_SINAD|nr:hypothetical protein [Singulisphaera acidiphila]AGA25713.1 hypothetical protein Sinac_1326 [Singulisphaera acidiphila DSM 18658]